MTEYTIAAFPTVYRGRKYRSRLEARWAAFFDALGWKHEYEPLDLGPWSPDFLLLDWSCFVEIKPIEGFCAETWKKMARAIGPRFSLDESCSILLCGVCPMANEDGRGAQLGWVARNFDGGIRARDALVGWLSSHSTPRIDAEIIVTEPDGWYSVSGDGGGWTSEHAPIRYSRHTMELWALASSTVQWTGRNA